MPSLAAPGLSPARRLHASLAVLLALALHSLPNAAYGQPGQQGRQGVPAGQTPATSSAPTGHPGSPGSAALTPLAEAFVWAYPYYEFMWLRHQALANPQSLTYTRLNQYRHQRHQAGPQDRWANGPIRDTLYSTAWIDLAPAPVLLQFPDTGGRYYVVAFVGADTSTFHLVGRRSTGTQARTLALVGPQWQGAIPAADDTVRAPSNDVYLNMRLLVEGEADMPAMHALQDRFTITPQPAKHAVAAQQVVPDAANPATVIDAINEALARNPVAVPEQPRLARYQPLGLCGAGCSWQQLPPATQQAWAQAIPKLMHQFKGSLRDRSAKVPQTHGWAAFRLPADISSNYRMRAASAANSGGMFGLEAAEATYFMALADGNDELLGQGRHYRLHLPQGGLPADAFWSITLYEFTEGGEYMLDNPLGRYSISPRSPGLRHNADGSLDIWIGPTPPADGRQANWLPSPAHSRFYLNARIYQPRAEVLQPSWAMPAIERLPAP